MAHTWTIAAMDYDVSSGGKTNVVTTVHWRCSKVDGDNSGSSYGSVGLGAVGDSFIEWADITEATAVGWAKAALGNDAVVATEAAIDAQIAELVSPTTGTGISW
mgnify:CR=1 FL=1|tara:strand:- start:297 stop:608 length:312 start_codon:yes stop_codon:yes gene_type:complete